VHGHGELHEVVIPIGDKQQQRKRTCLIRAVRMRLGYTTRGSDTKEYKNCLIDRLKPATRFGVLKPCLELREGEKYYSYY
jgi:hypothetical protein